MCTVVPLGAGGAAGSRTGPAAVAGLHDLTPLTGESRPLSTGVALMWSPAPRYWYWY